MRRVLRIVRGCAAKDGRAMKAEDNYLAEIRRLQAEGKLPTAPGIHHIRVAHDKRCSIYSGGRCDCEPEITTEEAKPK